MPVLYQPVHSKIHPHVAGVDWDRSQQLAYSPDSVIKMRGTRALILVMTS